MSEPCIWCGRASGTFPDWLVYPTRGEVSEGPENQVSCCRSCRTLRDGQSVAAWLADCRERGSSADPREIYRRLRDLDANHGSERTAIELRKLRHMLDLQFHTPVKRRRGLDAMFERAGNSCVWCGRVLSARHLESSYEHVIPKSRQGSNHHHNLLPACMLCNNRRSNMSPAAWIAQLIDEGQQPRIDLVWQSLVACTGPEHGVRMHARAVEFLDELEVVLDARDLSTTQPYLPDRVRPPVAPPRRYDHNAARRRRGRRRSA